MKHPTTELIAYVTETLSPSERAGVEEHLATCADCRREREAFVTVLADLRRSLPTAPEPHWGRWRAELRGRLEARPSRWRWLRPLPTALSFALAAGLLAIVWIGHERPPRGPELAAMEEVLERLDLLEDLELIHDLDRLAARGEG
jgi:anti-sigma factor RsiW